MKKNFIILIAVYFIFSVSAAADSCKDLEKQILSEATSANHCKNADDCIAASGFGCAFGCDLLIHEAEMPKLTKLRDVYDAACSPGLICDCPIIGESGRSFLEEKIICSGMRCTREGV